MTHPSPGLRPFRGSRLACPPKTLRRGITRAPLRSATAANPVCGRGGPAFDWSLARPATQTPARDTRGVLAFKAAGFGQHDFFAVAIKIKITITIKAR